MAPVPWHYAAKNQSVTLPTQVTPVPQNTSLVYFIHLHFIKNAVSSSDHGFEWYYVNTYVDVSDHHLIGDTIPEFVCRDNQNSRSLG
jgi:hypothetical protein